MSDELVDRIAQTIYDNCGMVGYRCREVAEAIVSAHFSVERAERSKPDGVMWAKDNRYKVHRWVTYWEPDDE